jgi:DNA-binding transcriptional regulator LsrR (DeoR family)
VDSLQAKEILLSDSHVQRAFDQFPAINIAFVGIGSPTPNSVIMRDGSIITQEELDDLLGKGAVGDIALRFFDRFGNPVCSEVDDHVIGMTLSELSKIERVIGVAGGKPKKEAILGALYGGFIDVLITDQLMANQLLSI